MVRKGRGIISEIRHYRIIFSSEIRYLQDIWIGDYDMKRIE